LRQLNSKTDGAPCASEGGERDGRLLRRDDQLLRVRLLLSGPATAGHPAGWVAGRRRNRLLLKVLDELVRIPPPRA
jgi:hypothetical protein